MNADRPSLDQIEVTIFGPGYGECVLVHLGDNQWIVVDSCINTETGKPAALEYFNQIGVSPQDAVKLIVVSHWHDDHIRGLSELVNSCPASEFCCSLAMTKEEFFFHIENYARLQLASQKTSGVSEIEKSMSILRDSNRAVKYAISNRLIFKPDTLHDSQVVSLSPSDSDTAAFLETIKSMLRPEAKTMTRCPSIKPNNTAVALWVEAGGTRILLGSDLEQRAESSMGWSAIIQSREKPEGRAEIFKIPHHGSHSGHNDQVWTDMLKASPIAILSPWVLCGKSLPADDDIKRLAKLTPECYITTLKPTARTKKTRPAPVERTIREVAGRIKTAQPPTGYVRLRNGGYENPDKWQVYLSQSARNLSCSTES